MQNLTELLASTFGFISSQGLTSTNVEDAIDEAYQKSVKLAGTETITGAKTFNANLTSTGTYNGGHLIVNGYHIWLDANGLLRYNSAAPVSDTDGTAINGFDAWTAPTLSNSFAAVSSPQQTIQYRKDAAGQVQIRGAVRRTTFPSNVTTVFTLPTGYRPPLHVYFVCPYISNTGEGLARVSILSDGTVVYSASQVAPASQTSLSFMFIQASFSTVS